MIRVIIRFILIANFLCVSLTSCYREICCIDNTFPIVKGVKLNYVNEIDIHQIYELSHLELSGGTFSTNLQGDDDGVIDIRVQYYEYRPGDASLYIEDGLLMARSISGNPVSIFKVIGRVPQSTSLRINAGTGRTIISDMDRCHEIYVYVGTGNIEISRSNVGKLCLSSGTGSITLSHSNVESGVVSTGTGSITLSHSKVESGVVTTGTGNIIVNNSFITRKDFNVGTGKIIENDEQQNLMLK